MGAAGSAPAGQIHHRYERMLDQYERMDTHDWVNAVAREQVRRGDKPLNRVDLVATIFTLSKEVPLEALQRMPTRDLRRYLRLLVYDPRHLQPAADGSDASLARAAAEPAITDSLLLDTIADGAFEDELQPV